VKQYSEAVLLPDHGSWGSIVYIWHNVRELQVVFTTDFGSYSNYNTLSISLRISKPKSVVITCRVLLGTLYHM
jgi:hypothetical protein